VLEDNDLPQGEDKAIIVEQMFDQIAHRYDLINRLMTFRMDVRWRRRTVQSLALEPGSTVLDLACGTGDFCNDLMRYELNPIGIDFSAGMLAAAATDAPLVRADALRLPIPDSHVDGITCGFALRNFKDLNSFFHEFLVWSDQEVELVCSRWANLPILFCVGVTAFISAR